MRAIREILAAVPDSCLKIFDINLRQQYYDGEMIHTSLELCHILKINDEELQRAAELFRLAGNPRESLEQAMRAGTERSALVAGRKGAME